jgi:hypothetical protein
VAWRGVARLGAARQGNHFFESENVTTSTASDTRLNMIKRRVLLNGTTPIMFDRYAGDNQTRLEWHQKIYLIPGSNKICIPALNIISFFTAHNTNSAPKRLRDKRIYKGICNAILSFASIRGVDGNDENLPIKRNGKAIEIGEFTDRQDPVSGLYLHRAVARLDKGIPNPKERPVLPLPWSVEFDLTILPNKEVKEQEIKNLLVEGGMAIGLGTFRGVFGKFEVAQWD